MRCGWFALGLCVCLACDSPTQERSPETPAPVPAGEASTPASSPAAGQSGADGSVAPSGPVPGAGTGDQGSDDALARVRALPAIDTREHPGIEDARDLNRAALAKHKDKDYAASAEGFIKAVTSDPGHIVARYNLGCALAMQGQADAAFEVLEQLENAGCPQCLGQVLVAERDGDWEGLRSDPRLRKAVARVRGKLPEPKAAADAIAVWFENFEGDPPSTLDPRRSIRLEFTRYLGEKSDTEKSKLTGAKRLERWVSEHAKEAMNGYSHEGQEASCRGECCAFESQRGISHHTLYLSELCFKMEGAQPVFVKSISFFED